MKPMIELELKAMLTKTEFAQLLRHFGKADTNPIVQQNTYYDTVTQTLKHNRAALRLRNFDTTSEWTIKQAHSEVASLELNQSQSFSYTEIPQIPDIQSSELLTFLRALNLSLHELHPTLTLQTERWVIPVEHGEFCLDRTTYFGITDYEIELETTQLNWAHSTFQTLLEQHHIPYRPADKKIARAFRQRN